jgi:protein SCO1/2
MRFVPPNISVPAAPAPRSEAGAGAGADEEAGGMRGFFTGAGFPVFLFCAAAVYELFLVAVVFAPATTGVWGAFAVEFKQWCFRYDPRTGGMEWAAVWVMLVEPAFVLGVALFLWRRGLAPLRHWGGWFRHRGAVASGVLTAALAMAGLFAYGRPAADADSPLPFPGERIRTQLTLPPFRFVDQKEKPFSFEQMRGRVVLVTGIYATCSTTCPEILRETTALLASLPAATRERVSVVALSLNPEEDNADLRERMTAGYGFRHPEFRYLNGEPAGMHGLLTQLGFSQVKNPRTGVIEHANLFLLIDAGGQIAYRFTLDPRRRSWLREGLAALASEASPGAPAAADGDEG